MPDKNVVHSPLMETLNAVNAAGLYTTVVRERAEFAAAGENTEGASTRPLPTFFWIRHAELCHPETGFYGELLRTLMTRSGIVLPPISSQPNFCHGQPEGRNRDEYDLDDGRGNRSWAAASTAEGASDGGTQIGAGGWGHGRVANAEHE